MAMITSPVMASTRKTPVVQQYIIRQKIVQVDNPYAQTTYLIPSTQLGLNYYYNIISDDEKQKQADLIAELVVQKLLNLGVAVENTDGTVTNTPSPPPEGDDVDNKIKQLFENKCSACHNGQNTDIPEAYRDLNRQDFTDWERFNIFDRVNGINLPVDKIMPKNQEPLSEEEVNLVLEWVRKGKK